MNRGSRWFVKQRRELPEDPRPPLDFPQQQVASVRSDAPAVELRHHVMLRKGVKLEADLGALCLHQAVSLARHEVALQALHA